MYDIGQEAFARPLEERRRMALHQAVLAHCPPVAWGVCGHSVQGRPLYLYRLGRGKRCVLYVGVHHALEWLCGLLLYRLLLELGRAGAWPWADRVRLYVLPVLNPDGVEWHRHGASSGLALPLSGPAPAGVTEPSVWQANAHGVDLNHNYPTGFAAYQAIQRAAGIRGGCASRYSGPYPFSEPETGAVRDLLTTLAPAMVLTLHSQGEEIFYHPVTPPVPHAAAWGHALSRWSGYRLGQAEGMAAYGGLSDYAAEVLRLPSYTLECGRGKNPLPLAQGEALYRHLRYLLCHAMTLVCDTT